MDNPHSLYPRCALVTGGARNIGRAVARVLASEGMRVAVLDICRDLETVPYPLSSREDLDRAVKDLSSAGGQALGLLCDVRSTGDVERAVQQVIDEFGRIDVLVNNAAVSSLVPITEMNEEAWDEVVDVCLKGTFLCSRFVVPHMIQQGSGRIVNISSVAGLRGLGLSVHYCAAKHGVIGFTKALAAETADHGISVNAVCPGTVNTDILRGLAGQAKVRGEAYPHFSARHLIRQRALEPGHIAEAVRWLALEEKGMVTGTVLTVDAGWTAL